MPTTPPTYFPFTDVTVDSCIPKQLEMLLYLSIAPTTPAVKSPPETAPKLRQP